MSEQEKLKDGHSRAAKRANNSARHERCLRLSREIVFEPEKIYEVRADQYEFTNNAREHLPRSGNAGEEVHCSYYATDHSIIPRYSDS